MLLQLQIALGLVIVCALWFNAESACSALLGSLVCIIPNTVFATKAFKYQGARAAKQIVNSFYKGEAQKIVLSAFLFTITFAFCRIKPVVFFLSYMTLLLAHWFVPYIFINKRNRSKSD